MWAAERVGACKRHQPHKVARAAHQVLRTTLMPAQSGDIARPGAAHQCRQCHQCAQHPVEPPWLSHPISNRSGGWRSHSATRSRIAYIVLRKVEGRSTCGLRCALRAPCCPSNFSRYRPQRGFAVRYPRGRSRAMKIQFLFAFMFGLMVKGGSP